MKIMRQLAFAILLSFACLSGAAAQEGLGLPSGYSLTLRAERDFLSDPLLVSLLESLGKGEGLSFAELSQKLQEHPGLFSGLRELAICFNEDAQGRMDDFIGVLAYDGQADAALAGESRPADSASGGPGLRVLEFGGDALYAYAEGRQVYFASDKGAIESFREAGERAVLPALQPGAFALDMDIPDSGSTAALRKEGIRRLAVEGRTKAGASLELAVALVFEDEAMVQPWYHILSGGCLVVQGLGELPPDYQGSFSQSMPEGTRAIFSLFKDLRVEMDGESVKLSAEMDGEALASVLRASR